MLDNENAIYSLHNISGPNRSRKPTKRWLRARKNLDSLARLRKFEDFDENFMHYLNSCWRHSTSHISKEYALATKRTRPRFVPESKQNFIPEACYVLKTIFSLDFDELESITSGPSKSTLRLNLFAPNIFRWLVSGNYLTTELLLKSLQPEMPTNSQSKNTIEDGDIMKAILAYDPDLYVLSIMLENSYTLSILDITLALKAILSNLNNDNLHLLRSNKYSDRQDIEIEMSRQEEAACSDIDRGLAILEIGTDMRGIMLQRAFTRLHSFGSLKVSHYLRQNFLNYELLFLLRLLRIEITEGGWTLRYTGSEVSEVGRLAPEEQAMSIIVDLMSSVINAIGIAGWLVVPAGEDDDTAGELLLVLQAEISRVLEGVTEATFMAGLLDEFLRYGKRRRIKPNYNSRCLQVDSQIDGHNEIGQIAAGEFADERLLRFGSDADIFSRETRKGARGELKKRSRREIGMQLSMKKSKYSRDRIQL